MIYFDFFIRGKDKLLSVINSYLVRAYCDYKSTILSNTEMQIFRVFTEVESEKQMHKAPSIIVSDTHLI